MSFLNTLEKYLKEDFEGTNYDFFPIEFDPSTGASFAATKDDSDLAVIAIKMVDGTPLDATEMDYDYADVYADVEMEDSVSDEDKNWLLSKLEALGYVENPVVINGKEIKVTSSTKNEFEKEEIEEGDKKFSIAHKIMFQNDFDKEYIEDLDNDAWRIISQDQEFYKYLKTKALGITDLGNNRQEFLFSDGSAIVRTLNTSHGTIYRYHEN